MGGSSSFEAPHPKEPAKRASKDEEAPGSDEFASPACSAHEMDPAYMWAERRVGWLARALSFLRSRRARR